MTRLTNDQRSILASAILADVPSVDYKDLIRIRALELQVAKLPRLARALWDDPETRGLLKTESYSIGYSDSRRSSLAIVAVPGFGGGELNKDPVIASLVEEAWVQHDARGELLNELKVNLAGINTHEQFAERFPELTKYLPSRSPVRVENLPATTNLIDHLCAAGLELDKPADPA